MPKVQIDSEVLAKAAQALRTHISHVFDVEAHNLEAALAAAGLDANGKEKPLTLNRKALSINTANGRYPAVLKVFEDGYAYPSDMDWLLATPDELAALRKALGAEERTCETCRFQVDAGACAFLFTPDECKKHNKYQPKEPGT